MSTDTSSSVPRSRAAYWDALSARRLRDIARQVKSDAAENAIRELVGELLVEIAGLESRAGAAEQQLETVTARRNDLLARLPVACVITDANGELTEVNREAALLLNAPVSRLHGSSLTLYFNDRDQGRDALTRVLRESPLSLAAAIRPQDRRARTCRILVQEAPPGAPGTLRWYLIPE